MSAATAVIIFVCVSNTCRSPMAEYLLRNKLEKLGIADRYVVKSRSLSTDYEPINSPASAQGVQVVIEIVERYTFLIKSVRYYMRTMV